MNQSQPPHDPNELAQPASASTSSSASNTGSGVPPGDQAHRGTAASSGSASFERVPLDQRPPYREWSLETQDEYFPTLRQRRWGIPLALFVLTCLSTFWVGISHWQPIQPIVEVLAAYEVLPAEAVEGVWDPLIMPMPIRQRIVAHWQQGLLYMACVVAILLVHELGHFVATIIYRVPATMPIFLPFPFNPIGTLGAVIGMQGMTADRRQIFDIGIAGPLAGLVIAVPLAVVGVSQLDLTVRPGGGLAFEPPLLMHWMMLWFEVPGYEAGKGVWLSQLNGYFAAAWVGLLVTGLNMMPVGQLDGGHITYALFGRYAHWIAKGVIVVAIAFMVYNLTPILMVMVLLLLIIGTDHPPTRDDRVRMSRGRWALGLASLSIPILCFPPFVFQIAY